MIIIRQYPITEVTASKLAIIKQYFPESDKGTYIIFDFNSLVRKIIPGARRFNLGIDLVMLIKNNY